MACMTGYDGEGPILRLSCDYRASKPEALDATRNLANHVVVVARVLIPRGEIGRVEVYSCLFVFLLHDRSYFLRG